MTRRNVDPVGAEACTADASTACAALRRNRSDADGRRYHDCEERESNPPHRKASAASPGPAEVPAEDLVSVLHPLSQVPVRLKPTRRQPAPAHARLHSARVSPSMQRSWSSHILHAQQPRTADPPSAATVASGAQGAPSSSAIKRGAAGRWIMEFLTQLRLTTTGVTLRQYSLPDREHPASTTAQRLSGEINLCTNVTTESREPTGRTLRTASAPCIALWLRQCSCRSRSPGSHHCPHTTIRYRTKCKESPGRRYPNS